MKSKVYSCLGVLVAPHSAEVEPEAAEVGRHGRVCLLPLAAPDSLRDLETAL